MTQQAALLPYVLQSLLTSHINIVCQDKSVYCVKFKLLGGEVHSLTPNILFIVKVNVKDFIILSFNNNNNSIIRSVLSGMAMAS